MKLEIKRYSAVSEAAQAMF